MARSDWAALLAAAVQIAYRHDTRPFLLLVKGLARQTSCGVYHHGYRGRGQATPTTELYIASVVYCLYHYCPEEDCSIAVETVGKNIIIQSSASVGVTRTNVLAMRIYPARMRKG